MHRYRWLALGTGLLAGTLWLGNQFQESTTMADDAKTEPKLGHMVYFKLNDASSTNGAVKLQLHGG